MFQRIVAMLPPEVIRFCGTLQWRLPVFGPLIGLIGRNFVAGEGTIKYGAGAGLKFDATGLAPGFILGTTDPLEQDALTKYLTTAGVFYDIGANGGFFCILAARLVGRTGKVYAFEPHPGHAERVRKNAALNEFEIEVIEAAVCDVVGETTLRLEGVSCPTIVSGQEDPKGVRVQTVAIDDLIARKRCRPPDYVVIDAEGAEMQVLSGMIETLRIYRPILLVEVHWLGQKFEDFFERWLRPLGYELQNLDGGAIPNRPARYHALLIPCTERLRNE